ncbi:TRAP transporter small permease [Buttiauxella gaviniae]|uniref:TRAP transporter small permease n=1 Tax=Enterobacterales TaxID=91347 RepID=UPI0039AED120
MQAAFRWLWNSIDALIGLLLTVMLILVFANVVLRYGFDSGLRASVELSRLGLVWVVMLGAIVVLRRDEHLAVAEITERLMPKFVPILRRIGWVITLVSVSMLFIGSFNQMMENWSDISQLTGLPSALFYLAGVISGFLMAVVAAGRIINPAWLNEKMQEGVIK